MFPSHDRALNAEEAAAKKAIEDKAIADKAEQDAEQLEKDKMLADLKKQIRDAEAVSEDERRALEIQKTIEHYDNLIALAKAQDLATTQLEKAKSDAIAKFSEDTAKQEIKFSDMTAEEKLDCKRRSWKYGYNTRRRISSWKSSRDCLSYYKHI